MRGVPFIEGAHDFHIATGGIRVFPRLAPAAETFLDGFDTGPALASGIKELDALMGGPIPWGFGVISSLGSAICSIRGLAWQKSLHVLVRGEPHNFSEPL